MHYYQHNIKSFNNATRHLTRVERALYRDLIELYYDTEQPLPAVDFDRLARRVMAISEEEKQALKYVLDEFFELTGEVYTHHKCDEEIEKYRESQTAKARAGKASAEARKKKSEARKQQRKAGAKQDLTGAEQVLNGCATNQQPTTNNHNKTYTENPPESDKPDSCPHQEIVNLYLEILPELAGVRDITEQRMKKLRARWKSQARFQDLEWWRRYFEHVRESDFLMGRSTDFQANFDFLIESSKFQKVIEGAYHRGAA